MREKDSPLWLSLGRSDPLPSGWTHGPSHGAPSTIELGPRVAGCAAQPRLADGQDSFDRGLTLLQGCPEPVLAALDQSDLHLHSDFHSATCTAVCFRPAPNDKGPGAMPRALPRAVTHALAPDTALLQPGQ